MRRRIIAGVGFAIAALCLAGAHAEVVVRVAKAEQTMYVYVDGYLEHVWPVSTARDGYITPSGTYRPASLDAFHRSSRYRNAPMPYSIFFNGGYAIHGSYDIGDLGRPASHGCIRLHPQDARELFDLVRDYGRDETRIVISR